MKIFKVKPVLRNGEAVFRDVVQPQTPDPERMWVFDGEFKAERWVQDQRMVLMGSKRKGIADFLACSPGSAIAMVGLLGTDVARIVRQCGELLPVTWELEQAISIINVAPAVDAGHRVPQDLFALKYRYEFDAAAIPKRSLFKLKNASWAIFASTGLLPQRDDFKHVVEREGYTGLHFREVWNNDGDVIEPLDLVTEGH